MFCFRCYSQRREKVSPEEALPMTLWEEHPAGKPGAQWGRCFQEPQQQVGVLTIRWPCVCVQVCWWMWRVDEGRAQRRNSFKVQAGKARLGAACTRLSNLILLRRLLVFSCLGFLPENKQRDLWRDWLHIWEKAFLESVKDNFLPPPPPPLSPLFSLTGKEAEKTFLHTSCLETSCSLFWLWCNGPETVLQQIGQARSSLFCPYWWHIKWNSSQ